MQMLEKILSTPTAEFGKASRFAIFQIKMWSHCARLLRQNRSGQQAAALSYNTIFGLIPLAIVLLFMFQSFSSEGLAVKAKHIIYDEFNLTNITLPAESPDGKAGRPVMLTDYLDHITANYFATLGKGKGSVTAFSLAVVIWASICLLSTIERAFNGIWHVTKGRSFVHRIINYWTLLTLGPLFIAAGIYVSTKYSFIGMIHENILSNLAPAIVSYLIALVTFFLLYFVLPNTKVNVKAAVWGSAIAALVWSIAKWGFTIYVVRFIPYAKLYGVLGLIPLGIFWIYITWLIVLFGLQLTFATQHLDVLDAASMKKTEEHFIANNLTFINFARQIALAFERGNTPVEAEVICSRLNVSAELGEKILNILTANRIIAKVSDPTRGYIPAKDPDHIRLSEIAAAAEKYSQSESDMPQSIRKINLAQKEILNQYTLKQILD
jgi:membrane protein